MKKLLGIMMVGLFSICLTGCGSKGNQLKCTGKVEGQDMTMTATIKSDKVTKVVVETKSVASSEEEAKQGVAVINGLGAMGSESGMTMTAEAKGKNVTIKATMDITKMSSDDIEEEFGASDLTKEKLESYAKEQGLTCK